eukprot:scaffold236_cov419-Prasinococcus_capsulatus_cf.AAC.34
MQGRYRTQGSYATTQRARYPHVPRTPSTRVLPAQAVRWPLRSVAARHSISIEERGQKRSLLRAVWNLYLM